MITQLELNGNAFAAIIKDDYNIPVQIYPLNALNVEAIYENEVLF